MDRQPLPTLQGPDTSSPHWRIAAARRMLYRAGLDSQIGGHVSLRVPGEDAFWVTPFQYFDETLPEHVSKVGASKLLKECSLPLTGRRVVDMVISELGVFAVDKKGPGGVTLIELADGVTVDEVKAKTQARLTITAGLKVS